MIFAIFDGFGCSSFRILTSTQVKPIKSLTELHEPQDAPQSSEPVSQFGVLEKSIFQNALTSIAIISKTERNIYKFRVIFGIFRQLFFIKLTPFPSQIAPSWCKNDFKTVRFRENRVKKHYV